MWWRVEGWREGTLCPWRASKGDDNPPELLLKELLLIFNFKGTEVQF